MQYDRSKLKTIVLQVIARCPPERLGAVKLHKVLYFADMLHYVDVGSPLTGSTYRKRPYGPTCDQLPSVLDELAADGAIAIRTSNYFGYRKTTYEATEPPEPQRLSAREARLLDEVVDFVCFQNTAKSISDLSHNRAWEMAEFGEALPYRSALLLLPSDPSAEALDWARTEVAGIEASRQVTGPMGHQTLDDFRARLRAPSSA